MGFERVSNSKVAGRGLILVDAEGVVCENIVLQLAI